MAEIMVAATAGFCFGVRRAVDLALDAAGDGPCFTVGPIVHNRAVTQFLRERGVDCLDNWEQARDATLIIRSHGLPRAEWEEITAREAKTVDATCPCVARIHRLALEQSALGRTLVVVGSRRHPEVVGIAGWAGGAPVVENEEEIAVLAAETGPDKPISVAAQTTTSRLLWDKCVKRFKKHYTNLQIFDTICKATHARQEEAAELAARCDAMVVVGDRASANTAQLVQLCRSACPAVIWVENAAQWIPGSLVAKNKIGITAGASTPNWLIEEVLFTMTEEKKDMLANQPAMAGAEEAPSATETAAQTEETAVAEASEPVAESAAAPEAEAQQPVSEPAQSEAEETFESMLEQSLKTLHTGDRVTGIVAAITPTEIQLDLGTKQAGYIPLNEISDDPSVKPEELMSVGQELEVFVIRVNDVDGVVMCSKRKIDAMKHWDVVEGAVDDRAVLEGIVTEENRGGLVVSVKGVRVFVPASQTGLPKDTPMSTMLKQKVSLYVTEVNRGRRRVVGSIRAVQQDERRLKAAKIWDEIEAGKTYTGTVKSLTSYGVFVDIGGVDGMVHITELAWSRVANPANVVKIGDTLKVRVLKFDTEKKKISLSAKDPADDPWQKFISTHAEGNTITVKIAKFMAFGAFAEILPGIDGLIHISEVSLERVEKLSDVLAEGQEVDVKIIRIDYDRRKISLSIKATMESEIPAEGTDVGPDEIVASADAAPPVQPTAEEPATTEDEGES